MADISQISTTFAWVSEKLAASFISWCTFGGAAATYYGLDRISDIDIWLRLEDPNDVLRLFPNGTRIASNGLALPVVELWWGVLNLKGGQKNYRFAFDDHLFARIQWHPIVGINAPIMPPEDIVVMKAILQRGAEVHKHDIEDISTILATWGKRLDREYLKYRAQQCDAMKRVQQCLSHLDMEI